MSAFRPTGRTIHTVKVPTSTGWVKRTTGTRDRNTARKMQAMLVRLGPTELRALDVLDRIRDGALTVPALWDLWVATSGDLAAIRERLDDADLAAKKADWLASVGAGAKPITVNYYARAFDSLVATIGVDGRLPRSRVTVEAIMRWLAGLSQASGTKRKYHASLSSFFGYCVAIGALPANPMARVTAPPAGKARDRHLTLAESIALADAQPAPFRDLSALLAGTGIEVGVALALCVRDVDVTHQEIRARGTKNYNRDRVAKVAIWAWSYVARAMAGKHPAALLFDIPGAHNPNHAIQLARKAHDAACAALGITDYTMRDARHTYAVRMKKAGVPSGQIGKQLGHRDATMVDKIYAVYEPTQDDRARWEQIASAMDADTAKKEAK